MTAFAMSSGFPNLPEGILDKIDSLNFSSILSVIEVLINPGEIQFTLIFFFEYSIDKLLDIANMPAFEEEFGSEISDSEAEKILTVGDAVKFIEGKRN